MISMLNEMIELNVGLLCFAILINIFLLGGALTDEGRNKPFMQNFIRLMFANIFMLTGEVLIWLTDGVPGRVVLLKTGFVLSCGCGYLVLICFAYCLVSFLREKKKVSWKFARAIAVSCAVSAVLNIMSVYNGTLFYIDATGTFAYTDLYMIVNLFDLSIIFTQIIYVLKYRKTLTRRGTFILLTFSIFPLAAMPLQLFWDTTPKCMATTMSLIALYMLFQGELTRQLAEKKKELAEKERQLGESRISTMISQIQPHFIYNTLGTIEQLCLEQPERASKLVHDFSLYLRGNFSQIDNAALIGISRELEHVRHYADIEQTRFPDMTIRFDLHSSEFLLPALTIQPLVENAIKHGLMKLESGGTVTICTFETDRHYCVSVVDDGVGFDPSVLRDETKHIGIRNIRGRLEAMCNGTLMIDSAPGKGTTALIRIPKEDEDK
ncbi:sensor histidine kinase [Fusicatenibacter saccharivorans]|uniref:sensor histidine kinase n=1 Tax=Fusicatenibacter saccharivorans TaxID=1150298 RepID=UPI003D06C027